VNRIQYNLSGIHIRQSGTIGCDSEGRIKRHFEKEKAKVGALALSGNSRGLGGCRDREISNPIKAPHSPVVKRGLFCARQSFARKVDSHPGVCGQGPFAPPLPVRIALGMELPSRGSWPTAAA